MSLRVVVTGEVKGRPGLTSAVSLVEPVVQYLIDRFKTTRFKAVFIAGSGYYLIGLGALLSYTEAYGPLFSIAGQPLFDLLEYTTDSILLPLGGLLIAIFVGYVLQKEQVYATLKSEMSQKLFNIWYFSIRYIAPLALIFMMLNLMGILKI